MAEAYLGEIRMFGYTYAPRGWADCSGQLIAISSNDALFALLGTTYGGDGVNNFKLPDLRGRFPVHPGRNNPNGTQYSMGQASGSETVTLTTAQLPNHPHSIPCNPVAATQSSPENAMRAIEISGRDPVNQYNATGSGVMAPSNPAGSGQPHNNMPPFLTVRFCIAVEGIFPSRD